MLISSAQEIPYYLLVYPFIHHSIYHLHVRTSRTHRVRLVCTTPRMDRDTHTHNRFLISSFLAGNLQVHTTYTIHPFSSISSTRSKPLPPPISFTRYSHTCIRHQKAIHIKSIKYHTVDKGCLPYTVTILQHYVCSCNTHVWSVLQLATPVCLLQTGIAAHTSRLSSYAFMAPASKITASTLYPCTSHLESGEHIT